MQSSTKDFFTQNSRFSQGFPPASLALKDLILSSSEEQLEKRERFAIKLRASKRKEIIQAKRMKLTKSRPPQEAYS